MPQVSIYVKNHIWEEVVRKAGGSPQQAVKQLATLVEMAYEQKKTATR
jgi:hypothetical protein